MKKIITTTFVCLWSVMALAQTFSGGTGTKEDPWLISNKADLEELSSITDTPGPGNTQQTFGKYFKLTQDITEPFVGLIGYEGFFKGDFDGAGHYITLNIQMPTDDYVGLFGSVKSGSVHDLAVKGTVVGRNYVGAIVANPSNEARLYNLVNYANVNSTSTSLMACVGGVIGGIVSRTDGTLEGATVTNCANYGTVTCQGAAVGGVIGYSGQQVGNTLSNLANYGHVEDSNSRGLGGTIGNPLWNDKVHRVVNFGTFAGDSFCGCLGNANPTDIGDIYYDKQFAHNDNAVPAQEKNTSEMLSSQMKEQLGEEWTYDDNLLPRPQMNGLENSDIAILYATPILLADGDWLGHVTKDFKVSFGNSSKGNVDWKSQNGLVDVQSDGTVHLKSEGNEVLIATYNGVSREVSLVIASTSNVQKLRVDNLDNAKWYNLHGQEVVYPQHGLYIHQGKKVIK